MVIKFWLSINVITFYQGAAGNDDFAATYKIAKGQKLSDDPFQTWQVIPSFVSNRAFVIWYFFIPWVARSFKKKIPDLVCIMSEVIILYATIFTPRQNEGTITF